MEYFLWFLADGIFGYFAQIIGYLLSLHGFAKRKIEWKSFLLWSFIFSVISFLIRKISVISFGFHTILFMVAFILIAIIFLKTPPFITVISVLTTTFVVLLCEVANMGIMSLIMGVEKFNSILQGGTAPAASLHKALLGCPTNIILIIVMIVFYLLRMKKPKEI